MLGSGVVSADIAAETANTEGAATHGPKEGGRISGAREAAGIAAGAAGVPPEDHKKLRRLAADQDTNMALLVRKIVQDYIARRYQGIS